MCAGPHAAIRAHTCRHILAIAFFSRSVGRERFGCFSGLNQSRCVIYAVASTLDFLGANFSYLVVGLSSAAGSFRDCMSNTYIISGSLTTNRIPCKVTSTPPPEQGDSSEYDGSWGAFWGVPDCQDGHGSFAKVHDVGCMESWWYGRAAWVCVCVYVCVCVSFFLLHPGFNPPLKQWGFLSPPS